MEQQYWLYVKNEEKFEAERAIVEAIIKVQSRNYEGLTFDKDRRNGGKGRDLREIRV